MAPPFPQNLPSKPVVGVLASQAKGHTGPQAGVMHRLGRLAQHLCLTGPSAARKESLTLSRVEPGKPCKPPPWQRVDRGGAAWQNRDSQGEVAFDGKLWIMGGWYQSYGSPPRDVWNSSDGESWDMVTSAAGWKHSDFPMTTVFKDRIFMMGGWTDGRLPTHSASNEVWCSQDGAAWTQLTSNAGWSPRLAVRRDVGS